MGSKTSTLFKPNPPKPKDIEMLEMFLKPLEPVVQPITPAMPLPDLIPTDQSPQKQDSFYTGEGFDDMPRCSTPTNDFCFHCPHEHNQRCCLYLKDKNEDMALYSYFVQGLKSHQKFHPKKQDSVIKDAISSGFTPGCHPRYTRKERALKMYRNRKSFYSAVPFIWIRQCYDPFPLTTSDSWFSQHCNCGADNKIKAQKTAALPMTLFHHNHPQHGPLLYPSPPVFNPLPPTTNPFYFPDYFTSPYVYPNADAMALHVYATGNF